MSDLFAINFTYVVSENAKTCHIVLLLATKFCSKSSLSLVACGMIAGGYKSLWKGYILVITPLLPRVQG